MKRPLSKKMIAGIFSILTGVLGGVLSSIGGDLYNSIKDEFFQTADLPVTSARIIFASIAIIGLAFVFLDYLERMNDKEKVRRRSKRY